MIQALLILALLGYLARLLAPWAGERLGDVRLLWVSVALHGAGLAGELAQAGMDSTVHIVLTGLALLVALGNLWIRRLPKMDALESVLLPLSASLLCLGLIAPGQLTGGAPLSWWLPVHIGFIVLGFGGLAVTFSLSLLYLWVRSRLKRKALVGISRLPSLAALDALNQRSMVLGFVALTAGAAAGALWAADSPDRALRLDLTTSATAAVWLWYAIGLHMRIIAGYRGRLAAWFGVLGFAAITVIMALATLVFQSYHGGI